VRRIVDPGTRTWEIRKAGEVDADDRSARYDETGKKKRAGDKFGCLLRRE
jgi:hypothetical protein